jgi:hypothetical protein
MVEVTRGWKNLLNKALNDHVKEKKVPTDAVKLKFIDVSHSTCFRHHYAHHQEYKKG